MKKHNTSGQLAFVPNEHAEQFLPSAWLMDLHNAEEQESVRSRFSDFQKRIRSVNRHRLLSLTGLYTLLGSMGPLQRKGSYPEVADLEFLQAIALNKIEEDAPALPPDEVSSFWKELIIQNHVAIRPEGQAQELGRLARTHAAYYRNPYGDAFFDRMISRITKEYDDRYIRDGSFAQLGTSIVALRQEIWRRFQDHFRANGTALHGSRKDVLKILRRYTSEIDEKSLASANLAALRRWAYQVLEDVAVQGLFLIEPEWIQARDADGLPMTRLIESLALVTTEEMPPEKISAANPIWSAPVVKSANGYALYSPITLMSFPFRCLMTLLKADPEAKARLEKVRGWFVEQEGKRLVEGAFPSATVILGGFWQRSPSDRVEADLLVLTANRLFILEAKGALIPDRVRFGALDATEQFLKNIWGKASAQGAALANHLRSATSPVLITNKKGEGLIELDPQKIRSISRFAISIEQVGPLMNAPEMLQQAGVVNQTNVAAPCVILSELELVLNHAPDELHKLHYLLRRSQIAEKYQIIGDELDIFTTYIQFGFSELPKHEDVLMLLGASYSLDDYRDRNGTIRYPTDSALKCAPYFQDLLKQAQKNKSPCYLELGLMLLDLPYRTQRVFEKQIKATFRTPGEENTVFLAIESISETSALAVVIVDETTTVEERRDAGMKTAAAIRVQFNARTSAAIVRVRKAKTAYNAIYISALALQIPIDTPTP